MSRNEQDEQDDQDDQEVVAERPVPAEPATPPHRVGGRCLCGAVSYEVELPSNWVAHCHCLNCRKFSGSAFLTWVSVAARGVKIYTGKGALRWFATVPHTERGFCSRCGSSLFFRSRQYQGELHIARASFEDAIDRRPGGHGFFDCRVDWFDVADELPKKAAPQADH